MRLMAMASRMPDPDSSASVEEGAAALPAALPRHVGDRQAQRGAVVDRVQAEPGRADRLLHRADVGLVPHLHRDHARLGHGDRRDLIQRHVCAIDLDGHGIEQRGRGATGAQASEIALQRFDRALHPALQIGLVICGHQRLSMSFCTTVDTPSPRRTAAKLPCSRMLKTTMGMLLSRHSAIALASMTLRFFARTVS